MPRPLGVVASAVHVDTGVDYAPRQWASDLADRAWASDSSDRYWASAAIPTASLTASTGAFLTDGAGSWWTSPRATELDSALYAGVIEAGGDVSVRHKSGATEQTMTLATFQDDDHNNPAVLVRSGYPMVVFYCGHNDDNFLRVRVSNTVVDDGFGPLGPETQMNMGGPTSYAVAHQAGSKVWCWVRTVSGRYWGLVWTDDLRVEGTVWQKIDRVFDRRNTTQKLYMASRLLADGETMRCAFANHPDDNGGGLGETFDVWYCEVNMTSGAITKADGTSVGVNLYSLPGTFCRLTDLDQVSDLAASGGAAWRAWVYSVGDGPDPTITWADFDATDTTSAESTAVYRYAVYSSGWTIRDIVAPGATFQPDPDFYFPGCEIAPGGDTVHVGRKDGVDWVIERYVTANAGVSWTVTELASSTDILARPWYVLGGGGGQEVMYNHFSSYTDYQTWTGNIAFA